MTRIAASALIALSLTMITFAQVKGYLPVSWPKRRVYREAQPAYFWTLIACYALVAAMSAISLAHSRG